MTEKKQVDENTELPSMDMVVEGNYYEGVRLVQEWRPRLKAREDIRRKIEKGEAVTEEEERVSGSVCDEVEKLGLVGIGTLIAHLATAHHQIGLIIEQLQGEMHRHYAPEIAEMERRAGEQQGEGDPFANGVREVA
jgi:hypothetical protein